MLKDSFDHAVNNADEGRSRKALKILLDSHASPIFGAAKTIEHEVAALNALKVLGYIQENADEYDLIEKLRITKTKARSLLYQVALRQTDSKESEIVSSIKKILENGQILRDNNFYMIEVSDPLTMDRLRKRIRSAGNLSDRSFSDSIAKLSEKALTELVKGLLPEDQRKEIEKKLIDSGLPDDTFTGFIKSILNGVAERYAGEVGVRISSKIGEEFRKLYADPARTTKEYIRITKESMGIKR